MTVAVSSWSRELKLELFFEEGRQLEIPREVDFCKCQIVYLIMGRTLHLVYKEDKKEIEEEFLFLGIYGIIS